MPQCPFGSSVVLPTQKFDGIYSAAVSQQIPAGGSSASLVDGSGTPNIGMESCSYDPSTGKTTCFQWAYTNIAYNMIMNGIGILRIQQYNSINAPIVTSWSSEYQNCYFKFVDPEDSSAAATNKIEILRTGKIYNLLASVDGKNYSILTAQIIGSYSHVVVSGGGGTPNALQVTLSYGNRNNRALCLDRDFKIQVITGLDVNGQYFAPRDGGVGFFTAGGFGFSLIPPQSSHIPQAVTKIPYEVRAIYYTPGWTCSDTNNGSCPNPNTPQTCTSGASAWAVVDSDTAYEGPLYLCNCSSPK